MHQSLTKHYTLPGGKPKQVRIAHEPFQKGDVIGCTLDLTIPQIIFTINGVKVAGFFKDFNTDSMFFPVVSLSAGVRLVIYTYLILLSVLILLLLCLCFLLVLLLLLIRRPLLSTFSNIYNNPNWINDSCYFVSYFSKRYQNNTTSHRTIKQK